MNRTRVYYNSACPVCRTGIENQQCRMAKQGNDDIEWIDIHANPERIETRGSVALFSGRMPD